MKYCLICWAAEFGVDFDESHAFILSYVYCLVVRDLAPGGLTCAVWCLEKVGRLRWVCAASSNNSTVAHLNGF